jgi:hypothetical protein
VSVKYAPPVADRLAEEKAKPYPEGAPRFDLRFTLWRAGMA